MVVVVLIHPRILNQRGRGACMHVDWVTLSYIQLGRENATEWEGTSQATIAFAEINLSRKIQRSQQKQVLKKRNSNTQHFVIYSMRRKNATEWKGTLLGDITSQATWDQRGKQKLQQVLEKRNPNRRRTQQVVIYSIQEEWKRGELCWVIVQARLQ